MHNMNMASIRDAIRQNLECEGSESERAAARDLARDKTERDKETERIKRLNILRNTPPSSNHSFCEIWQEWYVSSDKQ